tara:strand:+ start:807 stop:1199 length:393 start_codon:yes stop_codon:yes gene_type:complete
MPKERENAVNHAYFIERDAIAIVKTSTEDTTTSYVSPTEVKQINVHAVKLDEDFVASGSGITLTESPSIPEEFHEGLAQYAIAKGYELRPETLQAAQYFKREFDMCVREGLRYANKGRDGSGYHIKGYDF